MMVEILSPMGKCDRRQGPLAGRRNPSRKGPRNCQVSSDGPLKTSCKDEEKDANLEIFSLPFVKDTRA